MDYFLSRVFDWISGIFRGQKPSLQALTPPKVVYDADLPDEVKSSADSPHNPDTYTADAAIWDPKDDKFNRWPFAQRIAQTIASRHDPSSIVIGIYGAWGEGKTTVLNFIENELKQNSQVVCLRFNPWRYSDEEKLLIYFFTELASALEKTLSTKSEQIGEIFSKYGIAFGALVGQAETAKAVGDLLTSVELERLRDRIEGLLKQEAKRVVVLMDDIDRLDRHEIQATFRLIKLTVDFDYTAYVLAFDDDVVASALQERYSDNGSDSGRSFLEKIVQVPLELPIIEPIYLRAFCFQIVDQSLQEAQISINEEDVQSYVRHFVDGLQVRLRTPRMAKQYGNTLAFGLPIMKGEVNTIDFMLMEGIRVFYPKLYEVIKSYPDVFIAQSYTTSFPPEHLKQRATEIIDRGLANLNSEEKAAAKVLLEALFPRIKTILGNTIYGNDWNRQWADEQRVASPSYFPRYFSYAVPERDISDNAVASYISEVEDSSSNSISQNLKGLVNRQNADKVIAKLRAKASSVSPEGSVKLAIAIAFNGDFFPNRQSMFYFQEPFSQAAMLCSDLVDNVKDPQAKFELAKVLIENGEPISFAIEILHWLRVKADDAPNPFTSEQDIDLYGIASARIRKLADDTPEFLLEQSKDIPSLMSVWATWGPPGEASEYIQSLIEADPSNALIFIRPYVPTQWGVESGLSSKGDFERSQYDAVAQVTDPANIFQALQTMYGKELDVQAFPHSDGRVIDVRIAQQFAWVHRFVKQEKKQLTPKTSPNESAGESDQTKEQ